ncbi:MAG: hypothetical protein EZS28_022064 [Streblomastix strix]|uniref:Uncharacterized protein n=1 Tax=Streblomastix strix TaxID=222440 RepID=A0A5J4VJ59_9EUKA|nr:MAG: hypothetical protein EZS28_022064 [Streblomastix strix]
MKDKHITLWVQDDVDLSHETCYVDKEEKDDIQTHLSKIIKERSNGCNLLREGNLQLFRIKDEYVIQGCYVEVDKLERRIAFMSLITGVQNLAEAVDLLEDSSKFIDRTCSPDDIRKIKEAGRKQQQFSKELIYFVEDEKSINYKYEKNYKKLDGNIQICSYEYDAPILKEQLLKEQCRILSKKPLSKGDILVKHPYENNCYIHIEESEDVIFKYKCNKISDIARLLGASKWKITLELQKEGERIFDLDLGVKVKAVSANVHYKTEESNKLTKKYVTEDIYAEGNSSFTRKGYEEAQEIAKRLNDSDIHDLVEKRSPDRPNPLKKRTVSVELTTELNRSLDCAITLHALPIFALSGPSGAFFLEQVNRPTLSLLIIKRFLRAEKAKQICCGDDDIIPPAEKPIEKDPIIEEPIVEEPSSEEPIEEDPIIEEPTVEEPVFEYPDDLYPVNVKDKKLLNISVKNTGFEYDEKPIVMNCPKCTCEKRVKSGIIKGNQRYHCKECGCNYTVELKSTAKPQSLKKQALHLYFFTHLIIWDCQLSIVNVPFR